MSEAFAWKGFPGNLPELLEHIDAGRLDLNPGLVAELRTRAAQCEDPAKVALFTSPAGCILALIPNWWTDRETLPAIEANTHI